MHLYIILDFLQSQKTALFARASFVKLFPSLSLCSAHGEVEESFDLGVLSAGSGGDDGGMRAVLQIQAR